MTDGSRLAQISERLGQTARKLREDDVSSEEAASLAGECAELASEAVGELDRLARAGGQDAASGQEELL